MSPMPMNELLSLWASAAALLFYWFAVVFAYQAVTSGSEMQKMKKRKDSSISAFVGMALSVLAVLLASGILGDFK